MRALRSKDKLSPKDKLRSSELLEMICKGGNPKRPGNHQNPKGTENQNPKQTNPKRKTQKQESNMSKCQQLPF